VKMITELKPNQLYTRDVLERIIEQQGIMAVQLWLRDAYGEREVSPEDHIFRSGHDNFIGYIRPRSAPRGTSFRGRMKGKALLDYIFDVAIVHGLKDPSMAKALHEKTEASEDKSSQGTLLGSTKTTKPKQKPRRKKATPSSTTEGRPKPLTEKSSPKKTSKQDVTSSFDVQEILDQILQRMNDTDLVVSNLRAEFSQVSKDQEIFQTDVLKRLDNSENLLDQLYTAFLDDEGVPSALERRLMSKNAEALAFLAELAAGDEGDAYIREIFGEPVEKS